MSSKYFFNGNGNVEGTANVGDKAATNKNNNKNNYNNLNISGKTAAAYKDGNIEGNKNYNYNNNMLNPNNIAGNNKNNNNNSGSSGSGSNGSANKDNNNNNNCKPKENDDNLGNGFETTYQIDFPEDELGRKVNRCITDGIVKGFGGFIIGTVVSLLFFRRRTFPILIGSGFGIGVAYKTCEKDINSLQ